MTTSYDDLVASVRSSLHHQADRIHPSEVPFDPDLVPLGSLGEVGDGGGRPGRGRVLVAVAAGVVLLLVAGALLVRRGGDEGVDDVEDVETVSPPETTVVEPLRARLELSATTVAAGTAIEGVVILDNDTGEAFEVDGCGSLYAAGLASDTMPASIAVPYCLSKLAVPAGESRHPVSIPTTYLSCIRAEERADVAANVDDPETAATILAQPDCVVDPDTVPPPGETIAYVPPPLPPGQYRVEVLAPSGVPAPEPVDVTLTEGAPPTGKTEEVQAATPLAEVPVPGVEPVAPPTTGVPPQQPDVPGPQVEARLELAATRVAAGQPLTGRVVVNNSTGAPIQVTGCESPFGVGVESGEIRAVPLPPTCSTPFVIPVGASAWPVTIPTVYAHCASDPSESNPSNPPCLPAHPWVPNLPPGAYRTVVGATGLPPIAAIEVTLT
mgnify:CR=1 FL=1